MTLYEELADLASTQVAKFYEEQEGCRKFAVLLFRTLSEFLGCPPGSINWVDIMPDLSFGPRTQANNGGPRLLYKNDGYWYFGFELFLQSPTSCYYNRASLLFGVRAHPNGYMVKHEEEKVIARDDTNAVKDLCQRVYQDAKEYFRAPRAFQQKKFGFAAYFSDAQPLSGSQNQMGHQSVSVSDV